MRRRCSGPQASVRAIAASTASAVTWSPRPAHVAHEHRFRAAGLQRRQQRCRPAGRGPRRAGMAPRRCRRGRRTRPARRRPGPGTARAGPPWPATAPATRRGPSRLAAAASTELGALPAARAASAAARIGSPCRLTWAAIATLASSLSFGPLGSRRTARHRLDSNGCRAASSIETPCRLVTCVAGSMMVAPEASFIDWRMNTPPICRPQLLDLRVVGCGRLDHRQVELLGQGQALIVAEPGLEREVALGRHVRLDAVQRHHLGQRHRDVGDVGDHRTLGRADLIVRA